MELKIVHFMLLYLYTSLYDGSVLVDQLIQSFRLNSANGHSSPKKKKGFPNSFLRAPVEPELRRGLPDAFYRKQYE